MRKINTLVIACLATVFLFSCAKESGPTVTQEDHFEADGLVILDEEFSTVVHVWRGKVTGELHTHAGCKTEHLQIRFLDSDSNLVNPPDDEDLVLGWTFGDSTIAEVTRHEGDIWDFHILGVKEGETTIKLSTLHGDHADFSTPVIDVHVEEAITPCPEIHVAH